MSDKPNWGYAWNGHYFDITVDDTDYAPTVAHVHVNHVINDTQDISELRARLIAAAADLLEALKHARNQIQHPDEMIDLAIAKAEGVAA